MGERQTGVGERERDRQTERSGREGYKDRNRQEWGGKERQGGRQKDKHRQEWGTFSADKGRGVKNWQNLADVFFEWPLIPLLHYTLHKLNNNYCQSNGTVGTLLSAVLGLTKFWSHKLRINEIRG